MEIIIAASNNDLEGVRKCLDSGISPNFDDDYGRTVLMYATVNGHAEIAEYLIHRGARVRAYDHERRDALIYAAIYGRPKLVEKFLALGARLDHIDDMGQTARDYAAMRDNLECLKTILRYV